MWRSYYEERYAALLVDLYALNRDEYGFSPADSLAIAWYAARAAQAFQPTRSRAEAQKALPVLERYYAVLRERGGETFDAREAARLELHWWQLRRENAQPPDYGSVIALTTLVVFHADNAQVRRAGLLRSGNDALSRQTARRPDAGIRLGACRRRTGAFLPGAARGHRGASSRVAPGLEAQSVGGAAAAVGDEDLNRLLEVAACPGREGAARRSSMRPSAVLSFLVSQTNCQTEKNCPDQRDRLSSAVARCWSTLAVR